MSSRKLDLGVVLMVSLCLVLFLLLIVIIFIKRDSLRNLFLKESKENSMLEVRSPIEDVPKMEGVVVEEIKEGNVEVTIESDGSGSASLFINLEEDLQITGLEVFFQKNRDLEISNFVWESPFEKVFFESEDDRVAFVGIVPISSVDNFPEGKLLIGTIQYSGSGEFVLESKSFLSELNNPKTNFLDVGTVNFDLE